MDHVVENVAALVPDLDVHRMREQMRVAQELALSLGITRCHTLVREIDDAIVILTLSCAIVRVAPKPGEDAIDLMMRTFQEGDGLDFDVLPMMNVLSGVSGEMLRVERLIPESPERMKWANRMITYGIVHPSRQTMAMLVGTSPNVNLPAVGSEFDAIAKSFFWIG
jgi:hypothetical protein